MKKSDLKQIIKEEVRKVLNENETSKMFYSNEYFREDQFANIEEFKNYLLDLWGLKDEDIETKEYRDGEIHFVWGNVGIGSYQPKPFKPELEGYPYVANTNIVDDPYHMIYPKGSRKD